MTIQFLKYIVAVTENGSITEAAKQLHISQPSLSAAVKEVEKEVGFALFTRSRRIPWIYEAGDTGDESSGRPLYIEQAGETALLCINPALYLHGKCIC